MYNYYTETEPLCLNPTLCISYEECWSSCSDSRGYFVGKNVFIDNVPQNTYTQIWMGNSNIFPQKLRIGFSCAKMISSVKIRNTSRYPYRNVRNFKIKVREPNSTQWNAFISGTLSDPYGLRPPPLETFNGTAVIAKEVELSCLGTFRPSTSSTKRCALNYIGFA